MTLQEQYKEETGEKCTESVSGFRCYTDYYVEWLEEKINFNNSLT